SYKYRYLIFMELKSVQDKEALIIGTVIACNNELSHFLNENRKFTSSQTSLFKKNPFIKLYESKLHDIYNYNLKGLFEDFSIELPNAIENIRNNYYSYFNKVYSFLNGYELGIQKSLNESLNVSESKVKNPLQVNIETFKKTLKSIIEKLEKQDDIANYSQQQLGIKTFAKQPLFIAGYNICNNIALMQELQEKFGITNENLLAIVYDRSNKMLIFIPLNSRSVITYSILQDELKAENNYLSRELNATNYIEDLKLQKDNNTFIEIYLNQNSLNFKFTDNLYNDIKRYVYKQQINDGYSQIIK
ncbi:MAG: hypothetical protein K2L64_02345, partial [Ureaplasma sp.]|nr:hypothetical protein [Ureaplasma sp.]